MRKRTRLIVGIAVTAILMLNYFWMFWLFPNVSLALIGVFPAMMTLNLGACGGVYAILGMIESKTIAVFICIIFVIPMVLLQMVSHPVEPSVFRQIDNYMVGFLEISR
jgi:hypothetical protein